MGRGGGWCGVVKPNCRWQRAGQARRRRRRRSPSTSLAAPDPELHESEETRSDVRKGPGLTAEPARITGKGAEER